MNAPFTATQLLVAMQTVVEAGDGNLPVQLEVESPDGCTRFAFVDYVCVMRNGDGDAHAHTSIGGRQP